MLTSPLDSTWLLSAPEPAPPRRDTSREAMLALILLAGVTITFLAALAALQIG